MPLPPTLPHGLPLDSDRLLLFRLYCTLDDSDELKIILSDRRGISGAICWSAVDAKLTTDCEKPCDGGDVADDVTFLQLL